MSVPTSDIRYLALKQVRDWIQTVSDLTVIINHREEGRRARPDPPFLSLEMTSLGEPVEDVVTWTYEDGGSAKQRIQGMKDARVQVTAVGAGARLDMEMLALTYGECDAHLRPIGGPVELPVQLRDRWETQITQEWGVYYARRLDRDIDYFDTVDATVTTTT